MTTIFSHKKINFLTQLSLTTVTLLAIANPSQAAVNLVTNRANLGANDQLNWSSVGTIFPPATLTSPITATTPGGLNVTVTIPPAPTSGFLPPFPPITPPFVFQTNSVIPTNFANGDFILFTGLQPGPPPANGNPGPITLTFGTPVQGIGTQFAVDDAITPFTAFFDVFDSNNQLLANFSEIGTSSTALDNSAIFLGAISDSANISRVVYRSNVPLRAIGINQLSIVSGQVPPAATPESSSTLAIVGFGLLLAGKLVKSKS